MMILYYYSSLDGEKNKSFYKQGHGSVGKRLDGIQYSFQFINIGQGRRYPTTYIALNEFHKYLGDCI